jgi:hypothetical protein
MLAALPKSVANGAMSLVARRGRPSRWLASRPGDVLVVQRADGHAELTAPAALPSSLKAWRRRVRTRRLPTVMARALIVAGAAGTGAALAHRVWGIGWPAVGALAAGTFVLAALWSLTLPVSLEEVARLLDSQLGLDEQLATALALDRRPPLNPRLGGLLAERAAAFAALRSGDRVARAGWRREAWPALTVAALFALVVLIPGRSHGVKLVRNATAGAIVPQAVAPSQRPSAAPRLHLRVATTGTQPAPHATNPAKTGIATVHGAAHATKNTAVRPSSQAAPPWLHQHVASETGAKGRAVAPVSGLKQGGGNGAETGNSVKTQTNKGKAGTPPIGSIAAPGQDRNGNPAVGAATRESTSTATTAPKGAIQSPYGGGAAKATTQQHPGLVVGKNAGGTGGFGNGSAGSGRAGQAGQSAGAQTTGGKTGFQISAASGRRTAPGVRSAAPNAKSGTRQATSDQGAGVTTYVPPDGGAVPAEDRALVRAAHPLPASGARRTP